MPRKKLTLEDKVRRIQQDARAILSRSRREEQIDTGDALAILRSIADIRLPKAEE